MENLNYLKKGLKSTFNRFLETTTVHGFSRILSSEFLIIKIMWSVLLILFALLAVFIINSTISDYRLHQIVAENKEVQVTDRLLFPAVTICYEMNNETVLLKSRIDFMRISMNNSIYRTDVESGKVCMKINSGRDQNNNSVQLLR